MSSEVLTAAGGPAAVAPDAEVAADIVSPLRPRVEPAAWPVAVFAAVLVWAAAGPSVEATVHAGLVLVLVLAASVDLRHRVLPNRLIVPAIPAVLAGHLIADPDGIGEYLVAVLATGLLLGLFAVVTRGGLGMGDVKAGALMGAGLGALVLPALFVGTVLSGLVGLALIARQGLDARRTAIPLGPFLAVGTVAVLLSDALS